MTKDEVLEYVLKNKNIDLYIRTITTDTNELKSDLLFQLFKMSEEKLLLIYFNGYIEYMCFKICKRIKYGSIKDSDFFYKKQNIDEIRYDTDVDIVEEELNHRLYDELLIEVNKLHWYDKAIFQLYYKDGYNYREISELTGINIKSVAHNINKTKKFLKNKFKEV